MNNTYLWDKTGTDDEIENLEILLSVFRYPEAVEPVLPQVQSIVAKRSWGWNLRLSFGLAFASVATSIVVAGIWFLSAGNDPYSSPGVVAELPSKVPMKSVDKLIAPPVAIVTAADSEPREVNEPRPIKTVFRVKPSEHRVIAEHILAKKNRKIVLSDEEKYAYSQLMLALSITSEKLGVVRDTINRTEDRKLIEETRER